MTTPVPGTPAVVHPFPDDEPLSYPELPPEGRALRALLAVLADTGAEVVFPAALAPSSVSVLVAAGWRLLPALRGEPDATGEVVHLTAEWVKHVAGLGTTRPHT